jgi:hypothetical protein
MHEDAMNKTRTACHYAATVAALFAASCGNTGRDVLVQSPAPVPISPSVIVSGSGHTCSLVTDGTVRCWGNNQWGQIGNGTFANQSTPVTVAGIQNAVQIVAAGEITCALLDDGTVQCWGRNDYCQLANDSTEHAPSASGPVSNDANSTPMTVPGIEHATQIATTGYVSCARIDDGTVRCWGSWGTSSLEPMQCPRTVYTLSSVSDAEAVYGAATICALRADGTTVCDFTGALPGRSVTAPADTVQLIALGGGAECALRVDGTVWCWGNNQNYQYGNGRMASSPTPVQLPGLTGVMRLATNGGWNCAVLRDGSARCWGLAGYDLAAPDQCLINGTPPAVPCSIDPTAEADLTGAVDLSIGDSFLCARLRDGRTVCRGVNDSGQLGDGVTTDRLTYAPVSW